jgi:uncharacterized membrane protein
MNRNSHRSSSTAGEEALDKFYKVTKILGVILTLLFTTGAIASVVIVGHTRIEEQQKQILQIRAGQEQSMADRSKLRQDINDLDKVFMEVKTDVKWIRETMERRQPN